MAEVSPPRERAALALPAGSFFVQERRAGEYREYQVTVAPGGEVDLADLSFDVVAYDRLVRRRGGTRSLVHGETLHAGARGEVFEGEGVTPQLVVA